MSDAKKVQIKRNRVREREREREYKNIKINRNKKEGEEAKTSAHILHQGNHHHHSRLLLALGRLQRPHLGERARRIAPRHLGARERAAAVVDGLERAVEHGARVRGRQAEADAAARQAGGREADAHDRDAPLQHQAVEVPGEIEI